MAEIEKTRVIPLKGRLITASDGTEIGENFKALTNMRYTPTAIEGVNGMTKINEKCKLKRELEKRIWAVVYLHHNKVECTQYHENDPYTVVLFRIKLNGYPKTIGVGVSHRLPGDEHNQELARDIALTRAVRQIASTLAGF